MPVHPDTAGVEQDRAGDPFTDCLVDGAADRGWERDKDGLACGVPFRIGAVACADATGTLMAGHGL
jgi:hypothetical protein